MEVKLYVGNLSYSMTEQDLRLLFAQAGNVTSVDLSRDRQVGRSQGFAFVSMGTQAGAQLAIRKFNGYTVAGRALKVEPARAREAHSGPTSRGGASAPPLQKKDGRKPVEPSSGYQSRLSAFGSADRKAPTREPGKPQGGYQSRLGAFGGVNTLGGPRRRGGGKRD